MYSKTCLVILVFFYVNLKELGCKNQYSYCFSYNMIICSASVFWNSIYEFSYFSTDHNVGNHFHLQFELSKVTFQCEKGNFLNFCLKKLENFYLHPFYFNHFYLTLPSTLLFNTYSTPQLPIKIRTLSIFNGKDKEKRVHVIYHLDFCIVSWKFWNYCSFGIGQHSKIMLELHSHNISIRWFESFTRSKGWFLLTVVVVVIFKNLAKLLQWRQSLFLPLNYLDSWIIWINS